MVRRELYHLTSWITVFNLCQHRVFVDSSNLERCQSPFRLSSDNILIAAVAAQRRLQLVYNPHGSGFVYVKAAAGTAESGVALTCAKTMSYQAALSVIMPQMKHASSLAIAVFATLARLFLLRTRL